MRTRNIKIQFWLNEKEAEDFNKRVNKSGLSREGYLRHIIKDLLPAERPQPDFYGMMKELHAIGNNLNQLAHRAHSLNVVDAQRYAENAAALNKAVIEITEAVMIPRKIERKTK